MTLPYKMIVVCRGRALLCPLDPDKADVLFIGRSRTPYRGGVEPRPYGTPLFYCAPINYRLPIQTFHLMK